MTRPRQRNEAERAYNREYAKRWGKTHTARKRENNRRWQAAHQGELAAGRRAVAARIAALKTEPCADCGDRFDPVCMDFDHRPGEVKRFGIAKFGTHSMVDVVLEIAKCDLVCSNCHRLRTHRQRDHRAVAGQRARTIVTRQATLPFGGGT